MTITQLRVTLCKAQRRTRNCCPIIDINAKAIQSFVKGNGNVEVVGFSLKEYGVKVIGFVASLEGANELDLDCTCLIECALKLSRGAWRQIRHAWRLIDMVAGQTCIKA